MEKIEKWISKQLYDSSKIFHFFNRLVFKVRWACNKNYIFVCIGTAKFATQLQVVTFPGFGSEGHGAQPPQGDPFFHVSFGLYLSFSYNLGLLYGKD